MMNLRKRFSSTMSILFLVTFVLMSFSSCGMQEVKECVGLNSETPEETVNVSLVISPTANEPLPDISLAYDYLYDASYTYGYKAVIIDDGAPYLVFDDDLSKSEQTAGLSKQNKKLDAQFSVDDFIGRASSCRAAEPEKDVAKSIRIAADSIAEKEGKKYLVLIDNGLSTSGIATFKSLRGFDSKQIFDSLEGNIFPDLSGIEVIWYSIGTAAGAQEELSSSDIENLKSFWELYLQKSGAVDIKFPKNVAVGNQESNDAALPFVSTVAVSQVESIIPASFSEVKAKVSEKPPEERIEMVGQALDSGIKADETELTFKADSFELLDEEAAVRTMEPIVEYLVARRDKKVLLIGTTATYGSNESCIAFSLGRANTIKKIMMEMGVSEEQLITVGLGYDNVYHTQDIGEDGRLIEEAAVKNRSVIFFDAGSKEAAACIKK